MIQQAKIKLSRYWPFKPKPPAPVPEPGTTRRYATVAVELRLAPGSAASIERYGPLDPNAISIAQLESELEQLDRRIDILEKHKLDTCTADSCDSPDYVYQVQLSALTRLRVYKTRELAQLSTPVEPRKPMIRSLDDLYLRLYQTQDWLANKVENNHNLTETIQIQVHRLLHDLTREIRDLSYNYETVSSVEIVSNCAQELEQKQQRLKLLLTDQWHDYITQHKKK